MAHRPMQVTEPDEGQGRARWAERAAYRDRALQVPAGLVELADPGQGLSLIHI